MEWIKISEAAKRTQKPARTIRHKALLGHFRAKKDGRDWYIDVNSLVEHGWLPEPAGAHLSFTTQLPKEESDRQKHSGKFTKSKSATSNRKPRDVRSLGVYQELLENLKNSKECSEEIKNVLVHLGIGYFEFDNKHKIVSYRAARQELIKVLVHLHIEGDSSKTLTTILETIERVLAGIGGLIKQTEKRNDERHTRAKSSFKD